MMLNEPLQSDDVVGCGITIHVSVSGPHFTVSKLCTSYCMGLLAVL